jgi:hypothetical protein
MNPDYSTRHSTVVPFQVFFRPPISATAFGPLSRRLDVPIADHIDPRSALESALAAYLRCERRPWEGRTSQHGTYLLVSARPFSVRAFLLEVTPPDPPVPTVTVI